MKQTSELGRSWRLGVPAALPWVRIPWRRVAPARAKRSRGSRPGLLASKRVRLSLLGLVVLGALLGGGWLWFQDSSFVTVERVAVTGQSGADAGAIRTALVSAARSMTTLDVRLDRLYAAVSAFPMVRKLLVTTQFPHGMRIRVIERPPVAVLSSGGSSVAVAADGTLLRDLGRLPGLPRIKLSVPPGGLRVTQAAARAAVAAAAAAPRALLLRISLISTDRQHGLVAQLRSGPAVYLGDASNLAAKWQALLAVLADSGSAGSSYIDVTDPGHPAAGAGASAAATAAGSTVTAATSASVSSSSATAGTPGTSAVGGG